MRSPLSVPNHISELCSFRCALKCRHYSHRGTLPPGKIPSLFSPPFYSSPPFPQKHGLSLICFLLDNGGKIPCQSLEAGKGHLRAEGGLFLMGCVYLLLLLPLSFTCGIRPKHLPRVASSMVQGRALNHLSVSALYLCPRCPANTHCC